MNTITDTIKRRNENMHGNDESYYRIAGQTGLAAQCLLLYEMSLPFGLDLNNQINVGKSSTRMIVTMKDMSAKELQQIDNKGREWLKANKWVHDEVVDCREWYVFERCPVDKKNSGYTRQVIWMDKSEFREWKVDYYDRKNSLIKTLTVKGNRIYLDKYWHADVMLMVNHQTEKSTQLKWSNYTFRTGLTNHDFNKNSLKRVR